MKTRPKLRRAASQRNRPLPRPARARQERGLRTEAAILDATLQSLATRGIHETSLDLLAAQVGVAKSSILWHFGSKEGLLLRVAERAFALLEEGPAQYVLALPTLEERGDAMWRSFSKVIDQRPEVRRIVLYLIFAGGDTRPELRTRLRRLYRNMRTLFANGLRDVVPESQRRSLATLTIAALDGLFLQWLLDPKALDIEALHRQMRLLVQRAGLTRVAKRPTPRPRV